MTIKNLHLAPPGPRLSSSLKEAAKESSRSGVGAAVYTAAVLSLVAALVHLWASVGFFEVWWGYSVFFLTVASAQGLFAVVLLRWPGQLVSLAGILGNLAVVALYVLTRTSGVPYGILAGRVQEASVIDMTATAAEVATIVFLLTLLGGRARGFAINAVLLVGGGIWVLRFLGLLS